MAGPTKQSGPRPGAFYSYSLNLTSLSLPLPPVSAAAATAATAQISPWKKELLVAGAIAAVYALYLFTSEYHNLYYDAELYWELGHRFYQAGRFNLLAYDDSLRGYSYPLLNFACLAVRKGLHLEAVTVVKALNAGLAGLFFGVVAPRLWQASTGAVSLPSVPRRLFWTALGFVFWRDYFNFSLSDFPALLALGWALWQAQRRSASAAFAAGLAPALAVNVRPIYLASVPPALVLLVLGWSRRAWLPRLAVFALGAGLVLAPQWLINRRHFGVNTPLVLSESKELDIHNLYLKQLKWGLLYRKYESSVGRELPTGQLIFLDVEGAAVVQAEQIVRFESIGQYLRTLARHPVVLVRGYAWHLFGGLDISHPRPYLRRWETSVWLPWLNYSLWFWTGLVVLSCRPRARQWVVLAAVLLPCLLVLPLSMEARFLLPLHLLLLALVAFGPVPVCLRHGRKWPLVAVAYGVFVLGCFALSASVKQMVEPRFRPYLFPVPANTSSVALNAG